VIQLDHVLVAVEDLDAGGRWFEQAHGLASYAGGEHPGWGTANRIVPLGGSYIELIAAVGLAAHGSPFGRRVLGAGDRQPLGWAVRGPVDEIARRLGLSVAEGSRRTAAGETLRWRFAGFERAAAEPCLPFFIEWAPGTKLPGEGGNARLALLELRGDEQRLDEWLGPHDLPIRIIPGEPEVLRFELA
jgi:hypothetical protein